MEEEVPLVGLESRPGIRKRPGNSVPVVVDLADDKIIRGSATPKVQVLRPSFRKRGCLAAVLIVAVLAVADFQQNHRISKYFLVIWEYHWERANKRIGHVEPNAAIATTLGTRREMLDLKYRRGYGMREKWLVENHLQLLEQDMGQNSTHSEEDKTVVLLWSGKYPVWLAKVSMGNVKDCNIPCEWTRDPNYNAKHSNTEVTALACMLYGKNLCHGIMPETLLEVGIDIENLPVLGISWENSWRGGFEKYAGIDDSIPSQLDRLQHHVPYNLISSHELDSHIPVLYSDIAKFIDNYHPMPLEELFRNHQPPKKIDSVFFAISNCKAPIRPDRLKFIRDLGDYYPTSSFGRCLGSAQNRNQEWNSRSKRGNNQTLTEMGKYRFVYAPENSYGQDYVTEKVYYALQSGSVPIYLGAPNVDSFLPERNAVIHVSDFTSPQALGKYLQELSSNQSLLIERHLRWRTRPLPDHFLRLSKLVDSKSDYSFACKVCNCVRGRIGCPTISDNSF